MKILTIALLFYTLPVVALDGSTTPQGSTQPSSTGIMGGGTPGRSDSSQMSKQMYGHEDDVRRSEAIQKEEQRAKKAKKEKSVKRKKGTTKD